MDLKQLQYFVVSVDSGSLKKASEILYTSQPHVSKVVKSLETELQIKLLERKASGVEVTEAGRRVYEYACRIFMEAGKIQNIREGIGVRSLCVAANVSDCLTDLFRSFYMEQMQFGLHARYMECGTEEILRLVHRHTAELGFIYVDEKQMAVFQQMLEYRHLVFKEISKTGPLLFAGPKNLLYSASSVTTRELQNLRYVQMEDDQDILNIQLFRRNEDYQYHRRRGQVLTTNSRQLLMQMLANTELCCISCGLSPSLTGYEMLHGIPIRGMEDCIRFGFVRRRRNNIFPEAQRFTEYVTKHFDGDGIFSQ